MLRSPDPNLNGSGGGSPPSVLGGAFGLGVEVFETAGGYPGVFEEHVQVGRFDAQDPAHLEGGYLALVDETVKGARGDPEPGGGLVGAQPLRSAVAFCCHG